MRLRYEKTSQCREENLLINLTGGEDSVVSTLRFSVDMLVLVDVGVLE